MTTETPLQFSAIEARRLTDEAFDLNGPFMRAETESILKSIKESALKGLSSFDCVYTHTVIEKRLKNLGFITKVMSDQREASYMKISW